MFSGPYGVSTILTARYMLQFNVIYIQASSSSKIVGLGKCLENKYNYIAIFRQVFKNCSIILIIILTLERTKIRHGFLLPKKDIPITLTIKHVVYRQTIASTNREARRIFQNVICSAYENLTRKKKPRQFLIKTKLYNLV